ncbi:MAG: hypothetical protein ABIE07_10435 [Candidatus Zixiibacteriota bacterium]
MTIRMKEIIATVLIAIFFLVCYFMKGPLRFSTTVSTVIIILMFLVFVIIFVRTLQGKYVKRRMVFLLIGISLLLPFFMQFTLPIQISAEVRGVYDGLVELQSGSTILVSFDYDPPSAPELQPMAECIIKYAFEHDLNLIIMGLWPMGPQQAQLALEAAFVENPEWRTQKVDGVDYCNLGFQSGNEFVILRMGESIRATFPRDMNGRIYDSIPLVRNVSNFTNIDYSINLSAGKPGTVEWVQLAVDRYNLKMGAGNTAVQAPMAYPYVNSGQLIGLMGGMSGAAEFELLTEYMGKATTFLLSQSFAHIVVIGFIIIGNVAYLRDKKKKEKKS